MARIDFKFFAIGDCYISHNEDFESDKKEEIEQGNQDNLPVHHLALACSEDEDTDLEAAIELLGTLHTLSYKNAMTPIERLVGMIFAEGVKYGRSDVLKPLLERAAKTSL